MSLANRLIALAQAIGADVKALNDKVPEVDVSAGGPSPRTSQLLWVDTDEPAVSTGLIPAGGASGQLLKKNSGADYDAGWASADPKMGVYTNGQVVGSGAQLGTTWSTLTNLSALLNVPYAAICRVDVAARFQALTAAWVPVLLGLSISPNPLWRVKNNAPAGGALGAAQAGVLGAAYVHNAGQASVELHGQELLEILPNTNYTFQAMGLCTGAASASWPATLLDNHIMLTWWPK